MPHTPTPPLDAAQYAGLESLHRDLAVCQRCAEAGHRIESLPVFSGPPDARLMLIGQAPGVTEAQARRPFNGEAGRRLFRWLTRAGWDEGTFRRTCYMTAVTKCFPGRNPKGDGDRVPSAAERALCRPWLAAELRLVNPQVVVPVGALAIRLFYPPDVRLDEVIGTSTIDAEGRIIVPLPHPSGASRWHSDPANLGRIERAIYELRMVRARLGL